jgi:1-acyl-sn-glycerol-3-phosphate acyltransferase
MNHIHRLDTIIVIACLPGITRLIMARDVITNHPILSLLVRIVGRSGGAIVVDRHKINNNFSIRQAVVALKNGQNILIAPEGTRNTSEELGHFYDGVSFLALSTGVPIIPVATWGYKKQNILEMIREKEVNISFGEPLHFNKKIFSSKEDRRIITEIVRSKINLLLHESKNLSSFSQKEGTEIK